MATLIIKVDDNESSYEKIRKIQLEIYNQKLFENIQNPSEWQREIRKEWDRDFTNLIPPSGGQGA